MKAYSDDLRERVIKALQEGQAAKYVADRFDVCISWVFRIYKRFKDTGSYKALPRPGAPRKLSDNDVNRLVQLVRDNPSATLKELKEMGNFDVGCTTIYKVLKELNFMYRRKSLCRVERITKCK